MPSLERFVDITLIIGCILSIAPIILAVRYYHKKIQSKILMIFSMIFTSICIFILIT